MELWKVIFKDDIERGSIIFEVEDKYQAIELFEQHQREMYINHNRYLAKLAMFLVE
jgi:hypothetical protein